MTSLDILKKYWGYDHFRTPQEEIVQSVLSGEDILALLPTGEGKSICFQVPALMREGLCLVISPLIALMRDQVRQLREKRIPADYISSEQSENEIDIILDNAMYGKTRLLYVSPERLQNRKFFERVKYIRINFIAVDEAHCISQWGYDFRPSYLQVVRLRNMCPGVPFLALTASATPQVAEDVMEKLAFKTKKLIRKSFLRENLSYQAFYSENKWHDLKRCLLKYRGPSIVYVRSRKKTQEISDHLNASGFQADYYHAGLTAEDKKHKEENWRQERRPIIVATSAFGLGIDKANVRLVCHWELPDSVESYFQEAGRAGRDRQEAYATLLYNAQEIQSKKEVLLKGALSKRDFQDICQKLFDHYQVSPGECPERAFPFDLSSFTQRYKQKKSGVSQVIGHLECSGVLQFLGAPYLSILFKRSLHQTDTLSLEEASHRHLLDQFARKHPKIFHIPLEISWSEASKMLGRTPDELERSLEQLHQKGCITYEKSMQRLRFLLPREDHQIGGPLWKSWQKIQERRYEKFQALVHYVTKKSLCRSRLLLSYFGEKHSVPCGRCDICSKEEKDIDKKELFNALHALLEKGPREVEDILLGLHAYPKEAVKTQLAQWVEERKIKMTCLNQVSL